MAGKKNQEKQLYWQDIVNRQAGSGLSIRQFCVKERVSEPSFYAWRRTLAAGDRETVGAKSRQLKSRSDRSGNAHEFVPLGLIAVAGTLDVIHPLGYQVRITGEVNTVALKQVLEVLDERGAQA